MAIQFACPYCEQISSVPDSFAGKTGKCPSCAKVIEVPDPNAGMAPDPVTVAPPSASGEKACPFCGETIKAVAKKCKFCGEFMDKGAQRRHRSSGPRPENHMTLAILATVVTFLCGVCWPLGIVAIVFASQVESKHRAGDAVGAKKAADLAQRLSWWAIGLNFGLIALYVVVMIVANL